MTHTPSIARIIRAAKNWRQHEMVYVATRAGCRTGDEQMAKVFSDNALTELRMAVDALDASPSEVDEWIACSERMPPDDEMVVIYTNMGNLAEDWVDKDTGDFLNYPFLDESHARSATHWRPALEPPTTKGAP